MTAAEDDTRDGEDEVPETPVDPVSRPGDLWLLGPHRLLCGDATVATDVERVLGGPAYVDVAVERWQRFTGKAAMLDGSGEDFADLAAVRRSSRVVTDASGL